MPARSKVTMLPDEIKSQLNDRLLAGGFSDYGALAGWLAEQGFEISRSALHRYGQEFEEKCEAIKVATEQAKAIVGVVGDDEGNLNEALIRLIQQLSFDILVKSRDGDLGDVLPKMGVMVAKISKASIDQSKNRRQIRLQAKEEAAEVVGEMARQQGMNEDQARFWREKVLMGA